jgi:4-hydroxyphenylpyruvate dioxygenase-like putative hemolysin
MRESGNYGQARDFKKRTIGELRDHGFSIRIAVEDDQQICEMYEDEGVQVLYVPSGYYENRITRFPLDRQAAGE